MKVQILGGGCDKCKKLLANAEEAARLNGLECDFEKVTDMETIANMGVIVTPALAFDGKVVSSGKVLSVEEISSLFSGRPCGCGCHAVAMAGETKTQCCCQGTAKGGFLKRIFTSLLLVLVIGSILYAINRERKGTAMQKPVDAQDTVTERIVPQTTSEMLTVYYFHGTQRCMTCNAIEKLTREAVGESEGVQFVSVNMDDPQNEHFIKDFQLVSRVVVMEHGDKFEKFDRVWQLVRNPEDFTAYIRDGMERMVK